MKIVSLLLLLVFLICIFLQRDFYRASNYYDAQKYKEGYKLFLELGQSPENLHNIGNTLYHISVATSRKELLESALSFYETSLQKEENKLTRNNYEYLKSLLEQSQNEQNRDTRSSGGEKQESSSKDTAGSGSSEDISQDTQSGEESSSAGSFQSQINPQSGLGKREQQYILSEKDTLNGLTEQEKNRIDQYLRQIDSELVENRKYFGKKQPQNTYFSPDLFQNLSDANPFFSPEFSTQEKDW